MKSRFTLFMMLSASMLCASCSKTGADVSESGALLAENYSVGVNALLVDGYIALYGYENVSDISDMTDDEFVVTVSKVTPEGCIDADGSVALVIDSTLFPCRVASNAFNLFLTERAGDGYMDCRHYDSGKGGWQDVGVARRIPIDEKLRSSACSDLSAHRMPRAECVLEVLSIMKELQYSLQGIADLSDVCPDIEERSIKNGTFAFDGGDAAIENGISRLAGNVDALVSPTVAKVRPSVGDIVQKDNVVEIPYTIGGLDETLVDKDATCHLVISSADGRSATVREVKLRNGTYHLTLSGLASGEYSADFELRMRSLPAIRYRTVNHSDFCIFDASVPEFEFEQGPVFDNGAVSFKYKMQVNVDEDCWERYDEFGYHVSYGDTTEYKPLEALSLEDGVAAASGQICLGEDDFAMIDYASCIAKTPEIIVGMYARERKGSSPTTFNPDTIGKLVYSTPPGLLFEDAKVSGTDYIGDVGGRSLFKTHYRFRYNCTGTFWISKITYKTEAEGWDINWDVDSHKDGSYYYNAYLQYKKIATESMDRDDFLEAELKNGETLRSANCLHFSGPNSSPVVEVK